MKTKISNRQYVAEYLDPNGTLDQSPTSHDEAVSLFDSLDECFEDDGGCGMSLRSFFRVVAEIQIEHGWDDWSYEIG